MISMLHCRRRKRVATISPSDLLQNEGSAHGVALAQSPEIAAWKISAANPWSRQFFGIETIFFGPLPPDEVHLNTTRVLVASQLNPLAEPELMFEVADPDALDAAKTFSRMALCVEFPSTVLPDPVKSLVLG